MPKKILKVQTPGENTKTQASKDSLLPKIKPKRAMVSYMFFLKENINKLKEKNPTLKLAELAKKIGEMWRKMSEAEKKPFETLAKNDKVRHDRESKEFAEKGYFTNEQGVKSTDIKITIKDFPEGTVLPKRVKSAFVIFQAQNVKRLHAANPKQPITEVMKQSSAEWQKLSKGKLATYARLQEADKKRHEKQVKQLEKVGYFTSEDGIKSTDMKFKPKKLSREARKIKIEKLRKVKAKTIAKQKADRAKASAKKRALIEKQRDSAQKKRAQRTALKAREAAKKMKAKLALKELQKKAKAKKSKLLDLEKAKKAKSRAAAKLKVAKKSKGISKGRATSSKRDSDPKKRTRNSKQSADDQKMALTFFTRSKINEVMKKCTGADKSSKMKEATSMIKAMWEKFTASSRHRYLKLAREAATKDTSKPTLKQA